MSSALGKVPVMKIQRTNLNIFRKNKNNDMVFKVTGEDYNDPKSIVPTKYYSDFNRSNYKRHTLTFPIKVPTWYRWVPNFKSLKLKPKPEPLVANYAHMTGNQLLLTLVKHERLNEQETAEVLTCLARHPETPSLNLAEHPLVVAVIERIRRTMSTWKLEPLTRTLYSLFLMRVQDEELWNKAKETFLQKIYAYEHIPSTYFAEMFVMLFDKFDGKLTPEEHTLLLDQLPRYLHKMTAPMVVNMWEICLGLGVLQKPQDYLFERHFFMLFWKHPGKFSLSQAARIINGLGKLSFYNEDRDFYEKEFLPAVMKKVQYSTDAKELTTFLEMLESLRVAGLNEILLNEWSAEVSRRLLFVEKKLPLVQKAQFIEFVKEDLIKYKERKLKERSERKSQGEPKLEAK